MAYVLIHTQNLHAECQWFPNGYIIRAYTQRDKFSQLNWVRYVAKYAGTKPAGKRKSGRPRARWMDAMDRDMNMVGLEIKMADDRQRLRTTIDDHCGDPR